MNKESFRGEKALALLAAFLGWMFDGFEMGLFPVISRPALQDLIQQSGQGGGAELEHLIGQWNGIAIAAFLLGAATGGVLFGWLGDRLGRIRALSLSILTYALVSGLGAFATSTWQIVAVRFVAALGMGGEWVLGVALVMEIWRGQSRVLLAGIIGTAANAGFALVALLSLELGSFQARLSSWGLSSEWAEWRLLMLCGVLPALLTFLIRLAVPESAAWQAVRSRGGTSSWATKDLIGVLVGSVGGWGLLVIWSLKLGWFIQLALSLPIVAMIGCGFMFPVVRYLGRSKTVAHESRQVLWRMVFGAAVSGIPLLGTWAAVQWAPVWGDQISNGVTAVKAYTQTCSAIGAIGGSVMGALLGGWLGRRVSYAVLCIGSLLSLLLFYQTNSHFGMWFLVTVFAMGGISAAFYGWLPLYLSELFPASVRATSQGFCYNFGRIFAAVGALQTGAIMGLFKGGYPQACSVMGTVYLLGLIVIWWGPETRRTRWQE